MSFEAVKNLASNYELLLFHFNLPLLLHYNFPDWTIMNTIKRRKNFTCDEIKNLDGLVTSNRYNASAVETQTTDFTNLVNHNIESLSKALSLKSNKFFRWFDF